MTDTVTRLMALADKYAANYRAHYTPAGCENVNITDARQALEAELTRLFTPLGDAALYGMYSEPSSDAEMLEFARSVERAHGIGGES